MPLRKNALALAAFVGLAALAGAPTDADAQRRKPKPAQRQALSPETLVPTEMFPEEDGRRFGYPDGFDVVYFQTESGHLWKLTERQTSFADATPSPTPAPTAAAEGAPSPTPTPAPSETPPPLEPTADEFAFDQETGIVRPTFVSLTFADSAESAAATVEAFLEDRKDEAKKPHPNLAVFKIEKDPAIDRSAVAYTREFNLGDQSGGVRRAAAVMLARGNVVLKVDARKGLRDGSYDSQEDALERRARDVALYLVRNKL